MSFWLLGAWEPGNIEKQVILGAWKPGNTEKQVILEAWKPGNIEKQIILGPWKPGNTEKQIIPEICEPFEQFNHRKGTHPDGPPHGSASGQD